MAPALVMLVGAIVTLVAVVQANPGLLVVAAIVLVGGVVLSTVLARRRLDRPRQKVAIGVATAALAAVLLVPASMNVDKCTRLGENADLSGCDLSGQDLASEELRGADLAGADLRDTNLAGAGLAGSDLTGADLRGARLANARLEDATLTDTRLGGADFEGATLSQADLTGATVEEAVFTDADFSGADLAELDLRGGDLSGATLVGADLSAALLGDATLTGADMTDANMAEADLAGGDLTRATLDNADLSGADLSGGRFDGAHLEGADLTEANLAEVSMGEADLDMASFEGADLSGAHLAGASGRSARFEGADLTGAQLQSNDFIGATGLTEEALSAAFGVPAARLAGESALRGIVFDERGTIVDAVTPVADGTAVPDARAYSGDGEFHPAIVVEGRGDTVWAEDVRDLWAPTGVRFAELVVVVEEEAREAIDVCTGYIYIETGETAPDVTRYVRTVTIRVLSAHDAGVVAEQTFRGSDPRACQFEEFGHSVTGDPPNLDAEAQPWLASLIHPPANRPT